MSGPPINSRIIYALDFPTWTAAKAEIDRTAEVLDFYKVGLELFLAAGWQAVDYLLAREKQVMLDLKFLDIPATVAAATRQVVKRPVSLLTIHSQQQTIAAAVAARAEAPLKILGVTLLTSFTTADLTEWTGEQQPPQLAAVVLTRAKQALAAGADGLVAAVSEAALLRAECGEEFTLVAPGIRLASTPANDQRRTATPQEAVASGVDYLVIGRPIRESPDPLGAINNIKQLLG